MKGSHNTFTYLNPTSWWAKPISFIWRCQNHTITQQIQAGAQAFDLRVAPTHGGWTIAHGIVDINLDPETAVDIISNNCSHDTYIRIILERGSSKSFEPFRRLCARLQRDYPNINFYGGNFKPTWECLYKFPSPSSVELTLYQHIGSMQSWWGCIYPRLWAHIHRKDIPSWVNEPDIPIVHLDFI